MRYNALRQAQAIVANTIAQYPEPGQSLLGDGIPGRERQIPYPSRYIVKAVGEPLELSAMVVNMSHEAGVPMDTSFVFRFDLGFRGFGGGWNSVAHADSSAFTFTGEQTRNVVVRIPSIPKVNPGGFTFHLVAWVIEAGTPRELGWWEGVPWNEVIWIVGVGSEVRLRLDAAYLQKEEM